MKEKIIQIYLPLVCFIVACLALTLKEWKTNVNDYLSYIPFSGIYLLLIILGGISCISLIKLFSLQRQIKSYVKLKNKPDFFVALQSMSKLGSSAIDLTLLNYWVSDFNEARSWLKNKIQKANNKICIVSYSFISYKDSLEEEIRKFLEDGGELQILLLLSDSYGFYEKTGVESFNDDRSKGYKEWEEETKQLQQIHKSDLISSLKYLKKWKEEYGEKKVKIKFYNETPNITGILIDDDCLYLSSFYINPIKRGFKNPYLCIDDVNSNSNHLIMRNIFRNWFIIKFATGIDA